MEGSESMKKAIYKVGFRENLVSRIEKIKKTRESKTSRMGI